MFCFGIRSRRREKIKRRRAGWESHLAKYIIGHVTLSYLAWLSPLMPGALLYCWPVSWFGIECILIYSCCPSFLFSTFPFISLFLSYFLLLLTIHFLRRIPKLSELAGLIVIRSDRAWLLSELPAVLIQAYVLSHY